ncbi:MAG: MarR family transcriptional regulator [Lutibacter sp.]|nr:MAG: MarR family transcriptional regulator [Lutibacter sp.]
MKLDKENIDFENSIAPWLGKTVKVTDYFLQEALKENDLDLTKEQLIVLKKLHDQDGLNQNELAFLTLRNKSSLTRLLVKMEQKNYIKRVQSELDKRINEVYLTDEGKEIFQKTKPTIKHIITSVEKGISVDEKQELIRVLKKIQTNLSANPDHL